MKRFIYICVALLISLLSGCEQPPESNPDPAMTDTHQRPAPTPDNTHTLREQSEAQWSKGGNQ